MLEDDAILAGTKRACRFDEGLAAQGEHRAAHETGHAHPTEEHEHKDNNDDAQVRAEQFLQLHELAQAGGKHQQERQGSAGVKNRSVIRMRIVSTQPPAAPDTAPMTVPIIILRIVTIRADAQ